MKRPILITTIVVILLAGLACKKNIVREEKDICLTVQNLNQEVGPEEFREGMRLLSQKPYEAVRCLIRELHTVKETEILPTEFKDHESTLHVIWCIRALRYLTGLDFKGSTSYEFKRTEEDRQYWLLRKKPGELPFFAVWMSHDSIYIAPVDTQREILEKWRHWFSLDGKRFNYKSVENLDWWYF